MSERQMTKDEFLAMLAAVKADAKARLDDEEETASVVRLFGLSEEDALEVEDILAQAFTIAAMVMGPATAALNFTMIGVDLGIKLAEADQLRSLMPEDNE